MENSTLVRSQRSNLAPLRSAPWKSLSRRSQSTNTTVLNFCIRNPARFILHPSNVTSRIPPADHEIPVSRLRATATRIIDDSCARTFARLQSSSRQSTSIDASMPAPSRNTEVNRLPRTSTPYSSTPGTWTWRWAGPRSA